MTNEDIKNMTEDELTDLRFRMFEELGRRKEEQKLACYCVRVDSSRTWFKKLDKAIENHIDHAVELKDFSFEIVLSKEMIPRTEYELRPDTWYG